jgi:BASS family bile acid:Na+ symporter
MPAETLKLVVEGSMMLIVLGIGLEGGLRDLTYIRRRPGLVVRSMIAVNVVVPLAAILLCLVFPLAPPTRAGIVLMGVSPLCPLALGKMLKAGAQRAYVIGVYVCLILASILLVPLTVQLLGLGLDRDFHAPVAHLFELVGVTMLLPLVLGIAIASFLPDLAARAARPVTILAYLLFLPIVVLLLYRSGAQMLGLLGDGTLLVIVLTILSGFAAGHVLGGPKPQCRLALAQAAATRHPAMAAAIAGMNFADRGVMLAIFLFLFTGVAMSALYASWIKRRMYH